MTFRTPVILTVSAYLLHILTWQYNVGNAICWFDYTINVLINMSHTLPSLSPILWEDIGSLLYHHDEFVVYMEVRITISLVLQLETCNPYELKHKDITLNISKRNSFSGFRIQRRRSQMRQTYSVLWKRATRHRSPEDRVFITTALRTSNSNHCTDFSTNVGSNRVPESASTGTIRLRATL